MNNNHDALDLLIEECAEIIQAANKVKRFGPHNRHPERPFSATNEQHLTEEVGQLIAVVASLDLKHKLVKSCAMSKLTTMKHYSPETLEKRNDCPRSCPTHID